MEEIRNNLTTESALQTPSPLQEKILEQAYSENETLKNGKDAISVLESPPPATSNLQPEPFPSPGGSKGREAQAQNHVESKEPETAKNEHVYLCIKHIKRLGFKPSTKLNIFCSECLESLQVISGNLNEGEIAKYLGDHILHGKCFFGCGDGLKWEIPNDGRIEPTIETRTMESLQPSPDPVSQPSPSPQETNQLPVEQSASPPVQEQGTPLQPEWYRIEAKESKGTGPELLPVKEPSPIEPETENQVDFENFLDGAFIVSRSLFDSEVWLKPPYYRDIWLWFIGKANFRDVKDGDFTIHRGELYTTYAEIMEAVRFFQGHTKVKPSMQQVRDVVDWLVEQGMVNKIFVKPGKIPDRSPMPPDRLPNLYAEEKASKEQTIITNKRTDLYRSGALRITLINYELYQTLQNYFDIRKNRPQNRPKEQATEEIKTLPKNRAGTDQEQATPRKPAIIKGLDPPKNAKNAKNKKPLVEGEPLRLATLLLEEVRKNKPDLKEPNIQNWAKEVDLMLRIDKRSVERIERVILWGCSDHGDGGRFPGWATIIQSAGGLRSNFDKIEARIKEKKEPDNPLEVAKKKLKEREAKSGKSN